MDSRGEDEIEDIVPHARRQSSLIGALHGDPDWQVAGDDPRWLAHIETTCRTGAEHEAAAMALVSLETLSLAGAVALLEWRASRIKTRKHGPILQTMTARATIASLAEALPRCA